jgi:hypothetical protein
VTRALNGDEGLKWRFRCVFYVVRKLAMMLSGSCQEVGHDVVRKLAMMLSGSWP